MGRLRPHLPFIAVLTAATIPRVLAMLAYHPALWFNDSFDYLRVGLAPHPDPIRPDGYGVLLWLLRPLHGIALVVALQHVMGMATAIMIYALVRHRYARPWWAAILATAPVLFDAYQLELEQLVMSDVLFMFLLTTAVTVALWKPAITWRTGVAAGLLLALATVTREVGLPIVVTTVAFLAIQRVSWRASIATTLAAAVPLTAYALWFRSATGHFGLTDTDGVFLWGRAAAFADCAKIKPPADLVAMCPRLPPGRRGASSSQIWAADSPTGWADAHTFTAATNDRARRFALRAIAAQPAGYATAVAEGLALTFGWHRHPYPSAYTAGLYRFPRNAALMPASPQIDGVEAPVVRAYAGTGAVSEVAEPYAEWLRAYQRWVFLRGTMTAVILAIGLAGLCRRRDGALAWTVAACLLMTPLLTTDFDYRYMLAAMPFAGAAAALAAHPVRREGAGPPPSSSARGRTRILHPHRDRFC